MILIYFWSHFDRINDEFPRSNYFIIKYFKQILHMKTGYRQISMPTFDTKTVSKMSLFSDQITRQIGDIAPISSLSESDLQVPA